MDTLELIFEEVPYDEELGQKTMVEYDWSQKDTDGIGEDQKGE